MTIEINANNEIPVKLFVILHSLCLILNTACIHSFHVNFPFYSFKTSPVNSGTMYMMIIFDL